MGVSQSQFAGVTRRLVAVALVLWLGGTACLLGCEAGVSVATVDSPQASTSAESCPLSAGRDCCHRAEGGRDEASVGTQSSSPDAMMCCPLAGHSAVAAGKSSVADAPVAALGIGETLPASSGKTLATTPAGGLCIPDRGGTYLRCCVFLI